MYRVLIIEDEAEQADTLKLYLSRYSDETGIDFHLTWYPSAIEFIQTNQSFDLVFFDIQLPGINGMEAAEILRTYDQETPIIFVTDLAQYAVQGYQVDALDFMVKPVRYPDFKVRMDRAMRIVNRSEERHVYIPTRDGVHVLPASKIVFVEVVNHSLIYHVTDEEDLTLRGTLGKLEEDLAGSTFVRVSNSCLVNMRHIRSISGTDIHMTTGETCYMSRSKRRDALATIADYYGGTS